MEVLWPAVIYPDVSQEPKHNTEFLVPDNNIRISAENSYKRKASSYYLCKITSHVFFLLKTSFAAVTAQDVLDLTLAGGTQAGSMTGCLLAPNWMKAGS